MSANHPSRTSVDLDQEERGYGHGKTEQMGERRMSENVLPPDEHAIRVDLAACYRLVALYGWDDLIFTHISARVPGPEHHFLINPYGLMSEKTTAPSLVKIGLDGNPVGKSNYPVNPAGFTIHS